MDYLKSLYWITLSTILIVAFQNCRFQPGTETGDPSLQERTIGLSFSAYDLTAMERIMQKIFPTANADVTVLQLCIKRISFKRNDTDGEFLGDTSYDLTDLGVLTLSPSGTDFIDVDVPGGTYNRIDLQLNRNCETGVTNDSVLVTNDNGTFTTQSNIVLKFTGTFEIEENSGINLIIQPMVTELQSVTADGEISTALDAAEGAISN